MFTRPAIKDYNKRAGSVQLSRDSSPPSPSEEKREGNYESRQVSAQFEDSSHDREQRILSLLLDRILAIAFRCRPDEQRTMEFISEGCFQLTGYQPADIIQNKTIPYNQIIHSEDREPSWIGLIEALQKRDDYEVMYRIHTASGQVKWIREFGRAIYNHDRDLAVLEGILLDITERKYSEILIQRQIERFEALRKIDMAITGSFDLRVTLDILLDQILTHLGADAADVLYFDPNTQTLEYFAGRGFRTNSLQHTRLRPGEGYAGIAALEHHAVRVNNLSVTLGELKRAPQIVNEGFYAYYGVPLIAKGQVKGILEVFHRRLFEPAPEWIEFLETLAGQAAIAIENATLFNDLQRSNVELSIAYDATLEGWSRALELRDQSIIGHTHRVSDLSIQLAHTLGLNEAGLVNIRRGALLHDIGEMGIPDQILLKPGPLSEEEWLTVRQHPISAYKLLSSIPNLRPALDIPYCHHERWDGTGYPRGLKGETIPLSARIFTVVDVWDTLLSDRPYRRAWTKQETIQYLHEQSGKQFDPNVVEAFLIMIDVKFN